MRVRITDEQRQRVFGWIESWRPRLFLHHYKIDVVFSAKPNPQDQTEETTTYADVEPIGAGLDAIFTIYPPFWKHTLEMQQKTVLHELLHIVAPDASEGDVVRLTEILWTRPLDTPTDGAVR